jgi:hypothetical protein
MVTIFTRDVTPRHKYIFGLVFRHWLKTDYRMVLSEDVFNNSEGILIRYEDHSGDRGLFIKACGLLSENEIRNFVPEISYYTDIPVLFPDKDPNTVLHFDIFAAIFWMVSRYEEYLPFTPDIHGRYEVKESLAYKNGFHQKPVVEHWIMQLVQAIQKLYPEFKPQPGPYSFVPTYDIDQAWAYLNKPVLRCLGAATLNILKGKSYKNKERIAILSGKLSDPFDSYDLHFELQDKYRLSPIYFLHPGTYGKYDKNISLKNKAFRELIGRIKEKAEIGIHPSYRAATENGLLEKEVNLMSTVTGKPVTKCRQHFLRITFPETYRKYISCGLTDDYSLGWASDNGFRAGTSKSFPFFDLKKGEETSLMMHPLSMMDGALKNYRNLTPSLAMQELETLIAKIKGTNGTFISLWHNEALGTSALWAGWKEVYEHMVRSALPLNLNGNNSTE